MDLTAYLRRIDHASGRAPSAPLLADLHLAHLLAVPFENLSISAGEAIHLRPEWLFDKIVRRRRGGFCFELNGLFAELLDALGFQVQRLAGRVYDGEGRPGIPFDHMCLRVEADGEAWLCDVGFGASFVRPLRLEDPGEQSDGRGSYRIDWDDGERILWAKGEDGAWARQFRFALTPYALSDFDGGCRFHQTSPESAFTQKRVITRLTPNGRVTLRDDRLLVSALGGAKREHPVSGEDEWRRLLAEQFDVSL